MGWVLRRTHSAIANQRNLPVGSDELAGFFIAEERAVMPIQTPQCQSCESPLQRDILYGGLRFYVCRDCGAWAVPYPPGQEPDQFTAGDRDE